MPNENMREFISYPSPEVQFKRVYKMINSDPKNRDIVFVCGGERLAYHQAVIFQYSSFLANLSVSSATNNSELIVTLDNVNPFIVRVLMDCIYSGQSDKVPGDVLYEVEKVHQMLGFHLFFSAEAVNSEESEESEKIITKDKKSENFVCFECNMSFDLDIKLKTHMKKHGTDVALKNNSEEKDSLERPDAPKSRNSTDPIERINSILNESKILEQNTLGKGEDSLICTYCSEPKPFTVPIRFMQHLTLKHFKKHLNEKYKLLLLDPNRPCMYCQKPQKNAQSFLVHIGAAHKKVFQFLPNKLKQEIVHFNIHKKKEQSSESKESVGNRVDSTQTEKPLSSETDGEKAGENGGKSSFAEETLENREDITKEQQENSSASKDTLKDRKEPDLNDQAQEKSLKRVNQYSDIVIKMEVEENNSDALNVADILLSKQPDSSEDDSFGRDYNALKKVPSVSSALSEAKAAFNTLNIKQEVASSISDTLSTLAERKSLNQKALSKSDEAGGCIKDKTEATSSLSDTTDKEHNDLSGTPSTSESGSLKQDKRSSKAESELPSSLLDRIANIKQEILPESQPNSQTKSSNQVEISSQEVSQDISSISDTVVNIKKEVSSESSTISESGALNPTEISSKDTPETDTTTNNFIGLSSQSESESLKQNKSVPMDISGTSPSLSDATINDSDIKKEVLSDTAAKYASLLATKMKCTICKEPQRFPNRATFLQHLSISHFQSNLADKYVGQFKKGQTCKFCEKSQKVRRNYISHLGSHHEKVLEFVPVEIELQTMIVDQKKASANRRSKSNTREPKSVDNKLENDKKSVSMDKEQKLVNEERETQKYNEISIERNINDIFAPFKGLSVIKENNKNMNLKDSTIAEHKGQHDSNYASEIKAKETSHLTRLKETVLKNGLLNEKGLASQTNTSIKSSDLPTDIASAMFDKTKNNSDLEKGVSKSQSSDPGNNYTFSRMPCIICKTSKSYSYSRLFSHASSSHFRKELYEKYLTEFVIGQSCKFCKNKITNKNNYLMHLGTVHEKVLEFIPSDIRAMIKQNQGTRNTVIKAARISNKT